MPKTIRPRGDLKINWESKNPILNIREMGIEWAETIGKGKVKLKFGNGVTHWNDLDYAVIPNESGILYNTKVGWETDNPILKINEMGIEWAETIGVGSISIKLGNGITPWNELNYGISDDITDKIISTIVPPLESDKNPILSEGDTIGEVVGKLNVQHNYLKETLGYERLDALANTLSGLSEKDFVGILSYLNNTKFDKVDLYDGTDSSSIELGATANAVRKVNEKTDNNASNISILNSNFEVLGKLQVYYNTTVGALAFNLIIDDSNTTYGVKFDNAGITYSKNINGTYATTWQQNNQMIANIFSGDVYAQVKAQINSGKRTGIMYFTNASSGFPPGVSSKIGYIEFINHNNTNFVALRCYSNSLRPVDGQMALNSSGITWYV